MRISLWFPSELDEHTVGRGIVQIGQGSCERAFMSMRCLVHPRRECNAESRSGTEKRTRKDHETRSPQNKNELARNRIKERRTIGLGVGGLGCWRGFGG